MRQEITGSNSSVCSPGILGLPKLSDSRPPYITVPVPVWEPWGRPVGEGSPLAKPPAPEGAGVGGGASLGNRSITHTASDDSLDPPKLCDIISASRPSRFEEQYGSLFNRFQKWATIAENTWISVRSIRPNCKCIPGKSWGHDLRAKPCHTRFAFKRRIEKLAIIHKIIEFEEGEGTGEYTLLTLTASHAGGWHATMDRLRKFRNLLLMIIRKYLPGIRYVWVGEPHSDPKKDEHMGYPHFHIVLSGRVDNSVKDLRGRGLEDKLRELWSEKWGAGSHTFGLNFEVITDGTKALNYLLKYVGKLFVDKRGWSDPELIFNAHLYDAAHRKNKDENIAYRTFGMCNEYNRRFGRKQPEPSVCLEARLFPMETDELTEEQQIPKVIQQDRQLIPDWFGNPRLFESLLAGSPDYTTRQKFDSTGHPFPSNPNYWGRPYRGQR